MHHRFALSRLGAALALMTLGTLPALATEFEVGDGKLSISGSVTAATAWRSAERDTSLLADVNSSLIGVTGTALTASAGRSQDDGNLNFDKGDAVSQILNGYLSIGYKADRFGAVLNAKAWYDHALEDATHPWGNFPNGYTANARLSDRGAEQRARFSGAVLNDLHVYGNHQLGDTPLAWAMGWQKLDWGNRFLTHGGLRELNPIELPTLARPGLLQRDQETRIAVPQLFLRASLTPKTTLEGFYQLTFEHNVANQCGSFTAATDYASQGCDAVMVGNVSDRTAVATGNYITRSATIEPSSSGQGGIALTHTVEALATKFGLYAARFHSRALIASAIKTQRTTGLPYLPGNADGLNPQYYTEFPEGVRMIAATFETRFTGGMVFGELAYRPNQPLQYNTADMIAGVVSSVAPTPLRAAFDALPPGGRLSGYERHKSVQLQLGASGQLPGVLGSAGLNWGGEFIYRGVPDLPNPAMARFGRPDLFGQGPVNGVCPPPAAPTQCSTDGFVSRHAYGYRLRAGLRYANVIEGLDLQPSLLFGQDLKGWAGDGSVNEGRGLAVLALRANLRTGTVAEVSWQPTWGGTYNNLRDRSMVQLFVGQRF